MLYNDILLLIKSQFFHSGCFEFHKCHTSANIVEKVTKILTKWDISLDKVIACVTDGAANIMKAAKDLFGEEKHVYCFGHLLNVVLSHAFSEKEEIYSILKKIQSIVSWFRQSSRARYDLKEIEELCVLNWSPTRWNSAYKMLNRYIDLSESINKIILKHEDSPAVLMALEVSAVREILPILELFDDITVEVSSETEITISKLLCIQDFLITEIERTEVSNVAAIRFRTVLLSELKKRVSTFQKNLVTGLSSLLDPRYKKTHFDPNECAKSMYFQWIRFHKKSQ